MVTYGSKGLMGQLKLLALLPEQLLSQNGRASGMTELSHFRSKGPKGHWSSEKASPVREAKVRSFILASFLLLVLLFIFILLYFSSLWFTLGDIRKKLGIS